MSCTGTARLQIWILSCLRDPKLEMAGKYATRHPWNVMQLQCRTFGGSVNHIVRSFVEDTLR
eukprot:scaffold146323_cov32-Attheya_sp.AAC.1